MQFLAVVIARFGKESARPILARTVPHNPGMMRSGEVVIYLQLESRAANTESSRLAEEACRSYADVPIRSS